MEILEFKVKSLFKKSIKILITFFNVNKTCILKDIENLEKLKEVSKKL